MPMQLGVSAIRGKPEAVRNTFSAHCYRVRHANGVVLPRQHALLLDRIFDSLSQIQHCD